MPSYKLPDGKTTPDVQAYLSAWRALAAPLERAFKWRLIAYNPNLVFSRSTKRASPVTLDAAAVQQISAMILRLEEFQQGWKHAVPRCKDGT